MIPLKNKEQIAEMRNACRITAEAMQAAIEVIREGVSTLEIDRVIRHYIESHGAKPTFLGYGGFPGSACISINDQVIHGIPSKKKIIHDGDIVSIDVGAYIDGFHGDSAYTFPVGNVSEETLQLLKVTNESLYKGIEQAIVGNRVGDVSHAVEEHVVSYGYGIVKQYVGHGVGRNLHESPEVPNFGRSGHGPRLVAGMAIAIEPMINAVGEDVKVLSDGWTVLTKSGSPSAHFEHTIAVTPDGPVILTKPTII